MTDSTEISAYDRLVWPEGQVEHWLVAGERRRELVAYFGEAEHERLRVLALAAASARPDPGRVVFFVPGIMGTQLALARERPAPDNLLWLDPTDIQGGRLTLLTLPGEELIASGPVLYTWLPLKLALNAAGYTTRCFIYDWRRDLGEASAAFTQQLADCRASEIHVVGHSMGGLVARSVLATPAGDRVRNIITLGTPHGGSFAPVQAVRGVYPLVRRLAQLDPTQSPEALAREVFSSFHSLYQMLPRDAQPDLIDPRNWPRSGPQPNATLLARAPLFDVGAADQRIQAIAGHGFLTTTNVAEVESEFWYRYEYGGDGTVPVTRAVLPGCRAWYCPVAHNELPRDAAVQAALVDLLAGRPPALATAAPARHDHPVSASDDQLRQQLTGKLDWTRMGPVQRRDFLDSLNAPPQQAR
jgi:pimeloyl-ACP methyl ester carboxylesterase